jgi:hypothetical protein
MRKALITRLLICLGVGVLLAIVFTEVAFRLQGNTISRPPKTVVLDIPAGTSARVGSGACDPSG